MDRKAKRHDPQSAAIATVRAQLVEAMRVLRGLPVSQRDRPSKLQAVWAQYRQSGSADPACRQPLRPKATPEQIREMEAWLARMLDLDLESRRIVLARAEGIPWRRLEEIDGRSHTTLRKIEARALLQLAGPGAACQKD